MEDRYIAEMIEFALRWAPYGGAPTEETLPNFGMTAVVFYARISDALRVAAPDALSATDRHLLHLSCESTSTAGPRCDASKQSEHVEINATAHATRTLRSQHKSEVSESVQSEWVSFLSQRRGKLDYWFAEN